MVALARRHRHGRAPLVRGWLSLAYTLARPLAGLPPVVATALGLLVAGAAVVPAAAGGALADRARVCWSGCPACSTRLDGALAIGTGRASRRGFVLDSVVDRLTEVAYAAALWVAGAPGLARRRLRRAVLAARLPAGAGRPGRACDRDRADLGVGTPHPGDHDRLHARRRRCGRPAWVRGPTPW